MGKAHSFNNLGKEVATKCAPVDSRSAGGPFLECNTLRTTLNT
jgi:hypothetical protein